MAPVISQLSRAALAFVASAMLLGVPAALAAGDLSIGYVDQGAIASLPSFQQANRQIAQYKADLDRQFAARIRNVKNAGDQQRIAQEFQNKFVDKQRTVLGPLFQNAQVAIASIASSRNLSVVVDKKIIVVGGQDVTRNVLDLLTGPGAPVPPVSTPPPSNVGYVDQTQIDSLPAVKSAQDQFIKFRDDQAKALQPKLKAAKNDDERNKLLGDYQKTMSDEQDKLVKPLSDKTKNAIADVAKSKNLVLVVDRGNVVYGGTDITSDVTGKLK